VSNTASDVWKRVERRGPDDCWPWTGPQNNKGYGQMRVHYRQHPVHRLAFQDATGVEPGALCVLHRCDNPPCCNPAHLFLGTRGDNNRDCAAKRRNQFGSRHHAAKLTEAAVAQIRARWAAGEQGIALAADYGVTPQMISYIVRGENWTHV